MRKVIPTPRGKVDVLQNVQVTSAEATAEIVCFNVAPESDDIIPAEFCPSWFKGGAGWENVRPNDGTVLFRRWVFKG